MNITHDQSLIGYDSRELIKRGYGCMAIDVLRLEFLYTPDKAQKPEKMSPQQRNHIMKSVMDTIAARFPCYQYNVPRDMQYHSQDWALFFWCREAAGENDTAGDGRDYSYFTLTLNQQYSAEMRQKVCDQVLSLLNSKFAALSNLYLAIQYEALLDHKKIADDAARLAPMLNGKKCVYHGMEGSLILTKTGLFFKKKYAKRFGYALTPSDVLQIEWQMETAA